MPRHLTYLVQNLRQIRGVVAVVALDRKMAFLSHQVNRSKANQITRSTLSWTKVLGRIWTFFWIEKPWKCRKKTENSFQQCLFHGTFWMRIWQSFLPPSQTVTWNLPLTPGTETLPNNWFCCFTTNVAVSSLEDWKKRDLLISELRIIVWLRF